MSTSGTTNIKQITEMNGEKNMGMNIMPAKDHAEAFLMVETGRANAFFMDDILLYSLVANSQAPADYVISADALSVEPYGAMMRKDDPAFKKIVDDGDRQALQERRDQRDLHEVVPVADPAEGHQPERADERRAEEGVRQSHGLRRPGHVQITIDPTASLRIAGSFGSPFFAQV